MRINNLVWRNVAVSIFHFFPQQQLATCIPKHNGVLFVLLTKKCNTCHCNILFDQTDLNLHVVTCEPPEMNVAHTCSHKGARNRITLKRQNRPRLSLVLGHHDLLLPVIKRNCRHLLFLDRHGQDLAVSGKAHGAQMSTVLAVHASELLH